MVKMLMKPDVKHDVFYGKIKLISKSTNRIGDEGKIINEEKLMCKEDKTDNNIIVDKKKVI